MASAAIDEAGDCINRMTRSLLIAGSDAEINDETTGLQREGVECSIVNGGCSYSFVNQFFGPAEALPAMLARAPRGLRFFVLRPARPRRAPGPPSPRRSPSASSWPSPSALPRGTAALQVGYGPVHSDFPCPRREARPVSGLAHVQPEDSVEGGGISRHGGILPIVGRWMLARATFALFGRGVLGRRPGRFLSVVRGSDARVGSLSGHMPIVILGKGVGRLALGLTTSYCNGARLLFRVISNSYERHSLIMTTHIEFGKWGTILGDDKLALAAIDRVVHHGRLVEFGGESKRIESSLMLEKAAKE